MKSKNTLRNPIRVMLILTAFVVVAGIVISWDTDEFTLQTAVGQTNDTPETSEDFLHLERANRAFIDLVKRTRPAVVQITTQTRRNRIVTSQRNQLTPEQEEEFRRFFGDEFPFRRFFEEPEQVPIPNPRPSRGVGSGVIVSDDGYILTNNHVIEGTDAIKVTLSNGKEYDAELVGRDDGQSEVGGSDLAVIKIDAEALPVLPFGDSDALEVGEWVIAIGTPLNYSQSVTRGIVSAKGRTGFTAYGQFIQTDAPINQGNSGGALINIRGELVGINTLIATNSIVRGNIGIGFSIPSNLAQQILPQLIENGKVERGWLGISMDAVSAEFAEKLNLDMPRGVLVKVVGPKSPAQKAGIQVGDVILTFNEQQVQDLHHLRHIVGATKVGKSVEVTVIRENGKEERLTVKLGRRTQETLASLSPDEEPPIVVQADEEEGTLAGLQVEELTPEMAERYGYASGEKGVIVTQVERGSNAEKKGIKPGYLIQELEWMPVDDLESYARIAEQLKAQHKRRVLLYVRLPDNRGGDYVTLGPRRTSDR
ncbi:MAG: Do family serine endopeptidase [Candidatus Poribacteria bacterium]|nr:Do family serine endopeptidase [Candidatus Poribacteria bacterium]